MAKEDLTPFPKGVSGNPNGRPKGVLNSKTILERFLSIEKKMTNPLNNETENLTIAELIALKQIANALNGDLPAYKEIVDRIEGKVVSKIESTNVNTNKNFDITNLYGQETQSDLE